MSLVKKIFPLLKFNALVTLRLSQSYISLINMNLLSTAHMWYAERDNITVIKIQEKLYINVYEIIFQQRENDNSSILFTGARSIWHIICRCMRLVISAQRI